MPIAPPCLQFLGTAPGRRSWIGAVLLALPMLAGAQPASPVPAVSNLPPFLQTLVHNGKARVLRSFATEVPGLTGYVVRYEGRASLVYAEHGYLFFGDLVSPGGDDLSARYGDRYLPKPDVAATVKQLEHRGHLIVEGADSAPVLYVFADPNCIFCHRFYRMAEPLVRAGKLQLRWAMVGFLKSTSAGRAVAILGAKDPVKALHTNQARFDTGAEEGGIPPARDPDSSLQALLKANFAAMRAAGGNGTPTLLYRTGSKKWAARVGVPTGSWLNAYVQGKPPPDTGNR